MFWRQPSKGAPARFSLEGKPAEMPVPCRRRRRTARLRDRSAYRDREPTRHAYGIVTPGEPRHNDPCVGVKYFFRYQLHKSTY
jgi:hypothetical protein